MNKYYLLLLSCSKFIWHLEKKFINTSKKKAERFSTPDSIAIILYQILHIKYIVKLYTRSFNVLKDCTQYAFSRHNLK